MSTERGSRGPAGAAADDGLPGGSASGPHGDGEGEARGRPASGPRGDGSADASGPRGGDAPSSWRAEVSGAARRALAALREHPRHLVLAALVIGLLLPHAGAAIVVPAALVATLAGRALPACLAVAALLGGASLADARLAALDAGVVANSHGRALTARAVVLEPVRERAAGPAVARIRLLEGLGAGEQVVMRVRRNAYAGRLWSPPRSGGAAASGRTRPVAPARGWPEVGDVVVVRGKIEPLGAFDAYQARRNAHARDRRDARRPDRRAARRRPRSARRHSARGRAGAGERPRGARGRAAAWHGPRRGRVADAGRQGRLPGARDSRTSSPSAART